MPGCIHRGTRDDATTTFGYASNNAYCYLTPPPFPIKPSHQIAHCLCEDHGNCPLLTSSSTQAQRHAITRKPIQPQHPLIEPNAVFRWTAVFSLLTIFSLMVVYW